MPLTIYELAQRVPASSVRYDNRVSFVSLNSLLKEAQTGLARLILHKPASGDPGYISIVSQEHRDPVKRESFLGI